MIVVRSFGNLSVGLKAANDHLGHSATLLGSQSAYGLNLLFEFFFRGACHLSTHWYLVVLPAGLCRILFC
jgi:hypothetical protein